MAPYRDRPTWALLPSSKLPPASIVPELLGHVVADIENPSDHCVPQESKEYQVMLPRVLKAEQTSVEEVLSSANGMHVKARLLQIFSTRLESGQSQELRRTARTVVTRVLRQHPAVFKLLKESDAYRNQILEMMDMNPRDRGTAYMVVGIKTCFDMNVSDMQTVHKDLGAGLEIPINEALALVGVPIPSSVTSLNVSAEAVRVNHEKIFSSFTALGERIFAIQYRQIKRTRDWLKWTAPRTLKYGDLETMSNDVGLFGDEDTDEDSQSEGEDLNAGDRKEDDNGVEQAAILNDDTLDVRHGLPANVAIGDILITNL